MRECPHIAGVARALPAHYHDQEALLEVVRALWRGRDAQIARAERFHRNALVHGRHLALPRERYLALASFDEANEAYVAVATDLGAEAATRALGRAGLEPADVDHVIFVSTTGIATPSIDARVANRIGLPARLRRTPMFGLGCAAGVAAVGRAADYLRARPHSVALVIAVELCSLTLQREDLSAANLIATGLFGDAAAGVVLEGAARAAGRGAAPGPRVLDAASVFYPGTEHVMGWKVGAGGFRIVLSAEVPEMARRHLRADVDGFLEPHRLRRADLARLVCHPGGPRVLEAVAEALEVPPEALALTWDSLARFGNVSSVSVLLVLEDTIAARPARGERGLMLALGPGFCAELALLGWGG